jgi:hypothetical protein
MLIDSTTLARGGENLVTLNRTYGAETNCHIGAFRRQAFS